MTRASRARACPACRGPRGCRRRGGLREIAGEVAVQVEKLLGEVFDAERARPVLEGAGRLRIAARRAADAKVDAAGVEGFEHAELLGDLERAVVAEHDAAR